MQWHEKESLRWLTFDIFNDYPELICATFSRCGGVSKPPFDTLNVGDGLGDDESSIKANLTQIQEVCSFSKLIRAQQIHQSEIAIVSSTSPSLISKADGLITSEPHIGLMIKHADCQAAIFYDPICQVVCAIHAGWRGLAQNIYGVAINRLEKAYGSRAENLLCAISPSLGPKESEFQNYKSELPESFWNHKINSCHFDLWEIAYEQLIEAGLLPDHIEIVRLSTYSERGDFFSYRRTQKTGRNGTVVGINLPFWV